LALCSLAFTAGSIVTRLRAITCSPQPRGWLWRRAELLAEDVRWYGNFFGGACHNRDQVLATLREQFERGVRPSLETLRAEGDRVLVQAELSIEAESAEPGRRSRSPSMTQGASPRSRITRPRRRPSATWPFG
jgi:SnoaL-like domain